MPLPTVILPGYLAAAPAYAELEQTLQAMGMPAITVPLTQRDWWVTLGGRPVTPILAHLDRTIRRALQEYGTDRVNLVGHSAGGWISRIYLGEHPYCDHSWSGHTLVQTLITLGTPHTSQEQWTRKNLNFVNDTYPGAFYSHINYVCLAGKALYGRPSWRAGEWFTYQSYRLTCGNGDCWGDGVTPVAAAHLEGALNLTFDDVLHSPRSLNRPSLVHQWYGSPQVVQRWATYLH